MTPPDNIDDTLGDSEPLPSDDEIETLLECTAAGLSHLDHAMLLELRAHMLRTVPDSPERTTLNEMIDGQLALREITGADAGSQTS